MLNYSESQSANFIFLISEIFPVYKFFGFKIKKREKKRIYEKIVSFYSSLFYEMKTSYAAFICKYIFHELFLKFKHISNDGIKILNEIETYFIFPLLNNLYDCPKDVIYFIKNWDESGIFRIFLTSVDKLEKYGFKIKDALSKSRRIKQNFDFEIFEEI